MAGDIRRVIGANLRAARHRHKMTRKQVAERIGCVSWQAINSIEAGCNFPSMMTARRLCDVYGITMDSLFEEPKPEPAKAEKPAPPPPPPTRRKKWWEL